MKKLISLIAMTLLSGCVKHVYVFPDPPPKPPEASDKIRNSCPGLPPLKDKSIATLVETSKKDAYQYARCQAGQRSAIKIIDTINEQYTKYIEAYEKAKKDAKK